MYNSPKFNNIENKTFVINDRQIWLSRSVAINVVVLLKCNNKNYLLCGERGNGTPDFQGFWNVPCGYLDWNENGTKGCYREVWEETGLELELLRKNSLEINNNMENPWDVVTEPTSNKENVSLSYGTYLSVNKLPELSFENSEYDEVSKLEWLCLNELSDLDSKKWAFNHKELIINYLKIVKI